MAGQSTETQVNLKINGESAANTLKTMGGEVRGLRKELAAIPVDTQAFIDKAKELDVAENRLLAAKNAAKEVRTQMNALGDDTKKARADLLSLSPVGRMLQNLQEGFTTVRTAVGANIAGMNLLKLAIAATGIGALVIALVSLVQYFKNTDDGAKKLEGAMKALGFITNTLMNGFQNLGKFMVEAFDNPKKALNELGDFLLNNLINRFKAFAVILDGIISLDFKKVTDGTIQLASGVTNATDKIAALGDELKAAAEAGFDLANMIDAYDEAQANALVTNAKFEEQISRLLLQSKDRTKSEEDRLFLLDRASALETQRLQDQISLSNQNLEIKKLEFEQAQKTTNQTDEQYKAFKEAEAEIIGLRTSSIELQEKISNRRNALLEASENKRKTMEEAEKKAQEDKEKAELDYIRRLTDLRITNIVDEEDRKRAQIELSFQRGLEDAALKGQLTTDFELELKRQRQLALDELDKSVEEQQIQRILTAEELRLQEQQLAIENLVLTEQEKENRLYEVNRIGLENRLTLMRTQYGEQSNEVKKALLELSKLDTDHHKKTTDNSKKSADFDAKIQQQRFDLTASALGGIAELLQSDVKNRQKNAEMIKLFAAGEAIALGVKEVAGIWSNANMNALNAVIPGWGPAFAAVQTALAVVRTGAAVNNINSTKFAKGGLSRVNGGILPGRSHEQGGVGLIDNATGRSLGEAEGGEFFMVLSKSFTERNRPVLDMFLDASLSGSNKRFYREGGFGSIDDTNMVSNAPGGAAGSNQELMSVTKQQIELLASINNRLGNGQRIQATVSYEQSQSVADEAAQIEAEALA